MSAKIIIKKMKEAFGVDRDYELADKLGVEPGTVSGWKKRSGGVPLEYVENTKLQTGVDVSEPCGLPKEGPGMSNEILTMFLQIRGQMDVFTQKLDALADECRELSNEVAALKKARGGCNYLSQKSTSSRSRTGT